MASNWVLKPSQFSLLPCHSISFHCSSGLLLLVFCCISLSELYRKGTELPDPEEMLGNLDKVGGDPNDGTPCLRATAAHAQFLFLFAKTVVVASVFKKYKSTRLLSSYMTSCLEAFAVLTYTNSYVMTPGCRRLQGRTMKCLLSVTIPLPLLPKEGSQRKPEGLENSKAGLTVALTCTT